MDIGCVICAENKKGFKAKADTHSALQCEETEDKYVSFFLSVTADARQIHCKNKDGPNIYSMHLSSLYVSMKERHLLSRFRRITGRKAVEVITLEKRHSRISIKNFIK